MSTPRPFGDGLCAAVRHYLHQNNKTHLGQINAEILADIAERFYAHHEAQTKARKKKGDATPEEIAVYEAYPKKVGRADALIAIRGAMERTGPDALLDATRAYALCVSRWPKSYRFPEGRDIVPYPSSWFRNDRFLDERKEWMPAGMFTRPDDPDTSNATRPIPLSLSEPQGWEEEFPDCIFKTWKEMPDSTKTIICDHMNKVRA